MLGFALLGRNLPQPLPSEDRAAKPGNVSVVPAAYGFRVWAFWES